MRTISANLAALDDAALKERLHQTRTALQMAAVMGATIDAPDQEHLAALESELRRRGVVEGPAPGADPFGARE